VGNDEKRTVLSSLLDRAAFVADTEEKVCSFEFIAFSKTFSKIHHNLHLEAHGHGKKDDSSEHFATTLKAIGMTVNPAGALHEALAKTSEKIRDWLHERFVKDEDGRHAVDMKVQFMSNWLTEIIGTCRNGMATAIHDLKGKKVRDVLCKPCEGSTYLGIHNAVKNLTNAQYEELMEKIGEAHSTEDFAKALRVLESKDAPSTPPAPPAAPPVAPGATAPPSSPPPTPTQAPAPQTPPAPTSPGGALNPPTKF
jgi:hypothetical protein